MGCQEKNCLMPWQNINKFMLLMKHLLGGVKKGAFDEATAQKKFEAWKAQKDAKNGKITAQEAEKKLAAQKALLAQEVEQNKAKAAELAEKRKAAAEAEAAAALAAAKEAEAAIAEAEGKEEAPEAEAATEAEAPAAE